MVEVGVLASGSSGNCFFFQGNGSGFLIDAGISCKQIVNRLQAIGKDIRNINGIFVTHEHTDHIRGLQQLCKQHKIPVYMTRGTFQYVKKFVDRGLVNLIKPGERIIADQCVVTPFEKSHDALEPVSFKLSYHDKTVSYITDAGCVCQNMINAVQESDCLILESNHDVKMLEEGRYPYHLKKRIAGDKGHLSNYEASLLVLEHAFKLKHVFLSHLSEHNNTEDLALSTFQMIMKERKDLCDLGIHMTYRHCPTDVLDLS